MQRTNLSNVICLPKLVSATRGEVAGGSADPSWRAGPSCRVCVRVVCVRSSYFYFVHMNSK